MASEEHKRLSDYIKSVHLSLRKSSFQQGADIAWHEHCNKIDTLSKYAECMQKLATTHWETNCNSDTSEATSRIKWAVDFCNEYFNNHLYKKYRDKEILISQNIGLQVDLEESFSDPIKLLDVGSCYNPFNVYKIFDVLAIDLYPANSSVLKCDFLNVDIGNCHLINESSATQLQKESFDVITFCFLLEYIPSSELRISACENAYKLLKPGGILIINTPDSKHVGANSKIMKCWRYTLAQIGFNRIKYEKAKFMHCMAFRKSLKKEIAQRWALLYKEPYMEYAIHIPQDSNVIEEEEAFDVTQPNKDTVLHNLTNLQELPFQ